MKFVEIPQENMPDPVPENKGVSVEIVGQPGARRDSDIADLVLSQQEPGWQSVFTPAAEVPGRMKFVQVDMETTVPEGGYPAGEMAVISSERPAKLQNDGLSGRYMTREETLAVKHRANGRPVKPVTVSVVKKDDVYETYIDGVLQTNPEMQVKVEDNGSVVMPLFDHDTLVKLSVSTQGGARTALVNGHGKPLAKPAKTNRVQKGANVRAKNAKNFLKNNPFFKAKQ